jgi:hypothetical protein
MEAHLFNPEGGLVAVLPHPAPLEGIVRAAYGLGPRDVITSTLGGDHWTLTIFALEEKPAGDMLRRLDHRLRVGQVPTEQVTASLLELVTHELWDKGWSIKTSD